MIMEYDAKVQNSRRAANLTRGFWQKKGDDDDDDDDVGDIVFVNDAQVKGPFHQRGLDAREKEESDDDDDWVEENEATLQVKGPFHQRGLTREKEEGGPNDSKKG